MVCSYLVVDCLWVGFICMFSGLLCIKEKLCLVLLSCGEEMLRLRRMLLILLIRLCLVMYLFSVEKGLWMMEKCGLLIVFVMVIVCGL